MSESQRLFTAAQRVIPGGVNSPVRAFRGVGGEPFFVARGEDRRLLRCRNIQNELHARDPQRNPRTARTAYHIDPQDLLRIGRLESEGFAVAVIYHSHVDAGAYFSETDKRQALVAGEPAYPDATYVVTSVMNGHAAAVCAFRWNTPQRDFVPVDLGIDAGILTGGR